MEIIILRDTISKQTLEVDEKTAKRYLTHPVWSKRLEQVRTAKPEVLSQPAVKDESGVKKPVKKTEETK